MIVAQIDRDYINPATDELYRVGKNFELTIAGASTLFNTTNRSTIESLKTRFRVLDDDNIPYYGGWLYNDDRCEVQQMVLAWAAADAGATIIEINKSNETVAEWVREIG